MRSVVDLFPGDHPYNAESEKAVDGLDVIGQVERLLTVLVPTVGPVMARLAPPVGAVGRREA